MMQEPVSGPIPTTYQATVFRSRLEARWAVFFDALAIAWEYEPEGYQDGDLRYLPDFWLPGHECFWEVKPDSLEQGSDAMRDAFTKAEMLAQVTGFRVFVVRGAPSIKQSPFDQSGYCVAGLDSCGHLGDFAWVERVAGVPCLERVDGSDGRVSVSEHINAAARRARAYRFWDPK